MSLFFNIPKISFFIICIELVNQINKKNILKILYTLLLKYSKERVKKKLMEFKKVFCHDLKVTGDVSREWR